MFNLKPEIIYIAVIVILFMYMCPTQGQVITKKVSEVSENAGVTGAIDSIIPQQVKELVYSAPPGMESFANLSCPPHQIDQDGICVPDHEEDEVVASSSSQELCGKPIKRLSTDSNLPFLGVDDPQHPGLTYIGNGKVDNSWVDDAKTNTQLLTVESDPTRSQILTPRTVAEQHIRKNPAIKYDPNFMAKLNRQATMGNYNTGL